MYKPTLYCFLFFSICLSFCSSKTAKKISHEPTKEFITSINELKEIDFYIINRAKDTTYKQTGIYVINKDWTYTCEGSSNSVTFYNTPISYVYIESKKPLSNNWVPTVSIYEFQFFSEQEKNILNEKIKAFSDILLDGKKMNNYWFTTKAAYLVETGAVAFEQRYNEVTKKLKTKLK